MPSEAENIIKNIIPRLQNMGWDAEGFSYAVTCSAGEADIVYQHNGKPVAVIEAKKVGKSRNTALEQAKRYARALNTPLAFATDGATFLHAHHMKKDLPLQNHAGAKISIADFASLTMANLRHFINNPSLHSRVKSEEELQALFAQLNNLGRDAGLTSGVERLQEIAKIIFIKMLVDNHQYLDQQAWNSIMDERPDGKIDMLNHRIDSVRKDGIQLGHVQIDKSKSGVVASIVEILHGVDFNHRHYDAHSTLFQSFLSERARGGGSNDLGQYFTPRKIIKLLVSLADYKGRKTVYDPFCGTGGILCEFFTQWHSAVGDTAKKFGADRLFGSELSKPVAGLATMNMVLAGDGHSNIIAVDSLAKSNTYMQRDEQFHRVITNIPFAPKTPADVPTRYFALSHDGSDVANFVEHCINRCKSGGRIVLIVGRGFLTEKNSVNFRKRLLENHDVLAIYDLYSGIFAPYTQVHSCLFVIDKTPPQEGKSIDFFPIKDDADIETASKRHNADVRYRHGYYKVPQKRILNNKLCDLRGRVYAAKPIAPKIQCRIKDLVDFLPAPNTKFSGKIPAGLKKMTTPNSIEEGMRLTETKSKKQVEKGYGSFVHKLQEGAIVVSRLTTKRAAKASRYFGSAMVGDDAGHLITGEYYQFVPKNPKHTLYVLYHLRTKQCQDIVEWASGTGGQQRIDVDFVLNQPIPLPNARGIRYAEAKLHEIEKQLEAIETAKRKLAELASKF